MPTLIRVTRDQIDAARTLTRLRGSESAVNPIINRIAHAEDPATRSAPLDESSRPRTPRAAPTAKPAGIVHVTGDQIDAARTLIRLRGGEQHVDEVVRRMAYAAAAV